MESRLPAWRAAAERLDAALQPIATLSSAIDRHHMGSTASMLAAAAAEVRL